MPTWYQSRQAIILKSDSWRVNISLRERNGKRCSPHAPANAAYGIARLIVKCSYARKYIVSSFAFSWKIKWLRELHDDMPCLSIALL